MEIGKGSNAEHVAEEEAVSTALAEYHATLDRPLYNQGCQRMDKAQNEMADEAENTEVRHPQDQSIAATPKAVIAMLKARTSSDSDESEVTLRKPSVATHAGITK
jgi:hypothetical protein